MAAGFGSNPLNAAQASQELSAIRSNLASSSESFAGAGSVTGSPRVQDALTQFFTQSSDNREALDKLLERAAGLMNGLSQGTTAVDTGLAGALSDGSPAPTPARGPR